VDAEYIAELVAEALFILLGQTIVHQTAVGAIARARKANAPRGYGSFGSRRLLAWVKGTVPAICRSRGGL
jgi:hypothetical protein